MGTPMIINDQDCDVELLTPEDFRHECSGTAWYMMLQAELNEIGGCLATILPYFPPDCSTAAQIFFCHCSPGRLQLVRDVSDLQAASQDVQAKLEVWQAKARQWPLWHQIHPLSLTLKICYL